MGPFQPILDEYPATFDEKQHRRFQKSWFTKFPWLEYSPTIDAAYYFPCFLFATVDNSQGSFISVGFNSWKRINDGKRCSFLKHMGDIDSQHCSVVLFMEGLMNTSQHIDKVINPQRPEEINKNRLRVKTTIECIRWLTLQACALRGHDESTSSTNRGNLIQLIKLLGKMNKDINDVVLENALLNAKFIAGLIQKDILSILAKRVRIKIRNEIDDSKFCLLVEQMAIVLKFVDVDDTTAATLKNEISHVLSQYNLQICNLRGQGYDGASNMLGSWNGLQALFLRECPYAYHIHCFAHRLQLALVVAAEKDPSVWCFFSNLNAIVNVVSVSPKRHTELSSAQAIEVAEMVATGERETGKGANQMGNLHRPGATRWSSHFDSTCSLIDMYGAVITVLTKMESEGYCNSTRGEVHGHLKVMRSVEFIFLLHLMNKILGLSDMLCRSLQRESLDILTAMDLVFSTKEYLGILRDCGFDTLLQNVESVCRKHNVEISNMGDCFTMGTGWSCQQKDSIKVEHHYRIDVFNTAIDFQLGEINDRFNDETVELLKLSSALEPKDNFKLFDEDRIFSLAEKFYHDDFSEQEMHYMRNQLQHYRVNIQRHESFQNLSTISELCKMLKETNKAQDYYLIDRLIRLVLTLPVTTATTERAF